MSGLTDMEELIASVSDKNIANYLREAFVCYGAGAYRGCVVLVHTALFEGMRLKLHAVSSSNSAARSVLAVIEPDAAAQKVFEQKLIDQMRVNSIITQLEADILVQLNKQRNKAAHPSGHEVTAEEARFVFSEAVKKFLSKPIRQTSALVDEIISRLPDPNFFPSHIMADITVVVNEEISNLDYMAMPELISKISAIHAGTDSRSAANAMKFILALAKKREENLRALIVSKFISPKSSNNVNCEAISEIVSADPAVLTALNGAEKMRVSALLLENAKTNIKERLYKELRSPVRVLSMMTLNLGEEFVLSEYLDLANYVIENAPVSPQFIVSLSRSPRLLTSMQAEYRNRASSIDFGTANKFAENLPSIDLVLSSASTDIESLMILASVVRAAGFNAFTALDLANHKFNATPNLRDKAITAYSRGDNSVSEALSSCKFNGNPEDFRLKYLI